MNEHHMFNIELDNENRVEYMIAMYKTLRERLLVREDGPVMAWRVTDEAPYWTTLAHEGDIIIHDMDVVAAWKGMWLLHDSLVDEGHERDLVDLAKGLAKFLGAVIYHAQNNNTKRALEFVKVIAGVWFNHNYRLLELERPTAYVAEHVNKLLWDWVWWYHWEEIL